MLSGEVVSHSVRPHGLQPVRLLCPWDSPGKNTGVGCHVLLQGIFPTQGSNPGLLQCRWILYHLSHQGSRSLGYTALLLKMFLILKRELLLQFSAGVGAGKQFPTLLPYDGVSQVQHYLHFGPVWGSPVLHSGHVQQHPCRPPSRC